MNMEDVYVKDEDDDLPTVPVPIPKPAKAKSGLLNMIKRKGSKKEIPDPVEKEKNGLKSPGLISDSDPKTQKKNSSLTTESNKDEKFQPSEAAYVTRDSIKKDEGNGGESPNRRNSSKKDDRCPIPPSPNSIGKISQQSIKKDQEVKIEKVPSNQGSLIRIDKSAVPGSLNDSPKLEEQKKETEKFSKDSFRSENSSVKTENKPVDKDSFRSEKPPNKDVKPENKPSKDSLSPETKPVEKIPPQTKPPEPDPYTCAKPPKASAPETSKAAPKPVIKIQVNKDPKKNFVSDTGSVSSESLSRKSSLKDDPFLDEILQRKLSQPSVADTSMSKKPTDKKLTNSLIELRKKETQAYRADYNNGKACTKCVVF